MALTRAQLLMGNSSQGAVLTGQVQAVKQGPGIKINSDGTIEVDSQTVVGLMKLGQTAALAAGAYNGYNWPTATGTVGQQLTIASITAGVTTLAWDDPDMIPWTAKGQLLVGTGVNTQTLLNVGTDGQILIADSSTTSGLGYTSNYVSTTGATGAANMPAGNTAARPATPNTGATRYNSTTTSLEFWNGGAWETVASSSTNAFVEKTSDTGSAIMPAGTTAQRDGAPGGGYLRFNDTTDLMEFWNGTSWQSIASSATGSFVDKSAPTAGTPSAIIPSGTTAQRQTAPAPAAGYQRFNTTTGSMEFWDGTQWEIIPSNVNGSFIESIVATAPAGATNMAAIPGGTTAQRATAPLAAGYFRYNSTLKQMEFWDGTSWIVVSGSTTGAFVAQTVPSAPAGATPNAVIPAGTTAQRQTAPALAEGEFRFNTDNDALEVYVNGAWETVPSTPSGKFVVETVTTAPVGAEGLALMPSGTTAQRPTAPAPVTGGTRLNTTTGNMEWWNGTTWAHAVGQTFPTTGSSSAIIPSGTTANRQTAPAPAAGYTRYNSNLKSLEYFDGTNWVVVMGANNTTNIGLGLAISGANSDVIKVSLTAAATPPAAGVGVSQAIEGSVYFDNEYGSFFYRYNDGTSTQWVQALGTATDGGALDFPNAPVAGTTYAAPNGVTYTYDATKGVWTQGSGGALNPATLAEAAAGTLTTVYSSPETAVPKNASGMTGAAILPGGTTAQQPAGAAGGWTRYNTTNKGLEFFDGTNWLPLVASGGTAGGVNLNVATAAPTLKSNGIALADGDLYANTTTDQYFSRNTGVWVPFDQRNVQVRNANYTAKANDYVVVSSSGLTITLPATPIAGTVVTVVVAGTFLDTVVARNGSNIMALAQDITLDKQYAAMQFTFTDATNGWRLN